MQTDEIDLKYSTCRAPLNRISELLAEPELKDTRIIDGVDRKESYNTNTPVKMASDKKHIRKVSLLQVTPSDKDDNDDNYFTFSHSATPIKLKSNYDDSK